MRPIHTLRALLGATMLLLLAGLPSCQKEKADVSDLISKVPSSASAVIGVNVKSVLEKAGCEVKGNDVTLSRELNDLARKYNGREGAELSGIFSTDSTGIDPTAAVVFTDAYDTYACAVIADTPKFLEYTSRKNGKPFAEREGVKTSGNVAVSGAVAWVCLSSADTIDAKAIHNYANLSKDQSFLTNPFAARLTDMTDDIVGWGQIRTLARRSLRGGDAASVALITNMLFENAEAAAFDINFGKGEAKASATLLNGKGEPAKYLLPASPVDPSTIMTLSQNAQLVGAMSITRELVQKIDKLSSSLGGNMLGMFMKMLNSLDGTVAVAIGDLNKFADNYKVVVTTDGEPSLDLMQMLSQLAPTRKEDNKVFVTQGTVDGGLAVKDAAKELKGSTLGVVLNMDAPGIDGGKEGVRQMCVRAVPVRGGLRIEVALKGTDAGENFLKTLVNSAK